MAKIILEFDDLDQLAEFVWAMINFAVAPQHVGHQDWLRLAPEGKDAARAIARDMAGIFGAQ